MEMLTEQFPAFFFWATGQARYLLYHLIYLSVYCAGGWVETWPQLTTQWRGRSCNPLLNRYLLILRLDLTSQMVTTGVFFLIHPKTPPKGSNLDEKGTLVAFIKVLQCKAAYPRTCTTVHSVSKEIICLGRCCCTWKHLPAARFHQRADLRTDFPSMTSSICRAFKGSFISSAVVRDSSKMMQQLMKRHLAPQTLCHKQYRKSQDGVVAEAEPW